MSKPQENTLKLKKENRFLTVFNRLLKSPSAVVGMVIFGILVLIAIFGELIAPYDYTALDVLHANQAPSWEHLCGTDSVGRDIFSRLLVGTRYSLTLGLCSTLLGTFLGMIVGCIAGSFGGWVDEVIMRLLDIIQSLPGMVLNIAMACVIGTGFWECIIVLSIGSIPRSARMLRAQIMKIRDSEYIEAAAITNCSTVKTMARHLLPNAFSPLIISTSMGIGTHIMSAAGLAYLGLGVSEPTPEWGAMLSSGRNFITKYPWLCIFPGILIMLTVLALNLFGDGLRDALDPKLKK